MGRPGHLKLEHAFPSSSLTLNPLAPFPLEIIVALQEMITLRYLTTTGIPPYPLVFSFSLSLLSEGEWRLYRPGYGSTRSHSGLEAGLCEHITPQQVPLRPAPDQKFWSRWPAATSRAGHMDHRPEPLFPGPTMGPQPSSSSSSKRVLSPPCLCFPGHLIPIPAHVLLVSISYRGSRKTHPKVTLSYPRVKVIFLIQSD
jgi:hypothetical protein